MHPYEPAASGEIKGGIAFEQTPPPVLVELERPSDARSEVRQIESRRLCRHHALPPASYQPGLKARCHTTFGKAPGPSAGWRLAFTATSSTGRRQ